MHMSHRPIGLLFIGRCFYEFFKFVHHPGDVIHSIIHPFNFHVKIHYLICNHDSSAHFSLAVELNLNLKKSHSPSGKLFFLPVWDTKCAQLGRTKAKINQRLFKHNQPCGAMESHKMSLQLPTQSYLIAHCVCWSVSRRFLRSLDVWEPDFSSQRLI